MSTSGTRPKTRLVKKYVLHQLAAGLLDSGDPLPPEGELAKSLGVGRHSVRQAMGELTQAGIVERVQGKGTFVSAARPDSTPRNRMDAYALVVPEIRSGIYPSLIKGFSRGATASHQQSLLCETDTDLRAQGDVILRLLHSNVTGVAIVPVVDPMPNYQLQTLRSNRIPVVFCHRRTTELDAPLITWDWGEVGRLAGNTLADLGHKRIAFAHVIRSSVAETYEMQMRAVLAQRDIGLPAEQVFYGERSLTSALISSDVHYMDELVSRVLDAPQPATAVFCADDYVAERLFLTATQRGLRVPEDLSIMGFGPSWRDGALRSKLTAVTVDELNLGRRAVELLDEMSAGHRPLDSDEEIVMPVGLTKGETVGPPPHR